MISIEAHVYRFYVKESKGNMTVAAGMTGVSRDLFARRTKKMGIDFRMYRPPMCSCKILNVSRCPVCSEKNREATKKRYHINKCSPPKAYPAVNVARTMQMLAISCRMTAMQRFLRLSK